MKQILMKSLGSYRICDPEFFGMLSPYNEILTNQEFENEHFLAPALMEGLKEKQMKPKHDEWKS